MKKDEEKKLVAFRIPEAWAQTLKELPGIVGSTQQRITQDAMAILFGTNDPIIKKRHRMVLDAIKNKQVSAPFDTTTPPQWSNSAPIMLPDSMTLCTT